MYIKTSLIVMLFKTTKLAAFQNDSKKWPTPSARAVLKAIIPEPRCMVDLSSQEIPPNLVQLGSRSSCQAAQRAPRCRAQEAARSILEGIVVWAARPVYGTCQDLRDMESELDHDCRWDRRLWGEIRPLELGSLSMLVLKASRLDGDWIGGFLISLGLGLEEVSWLYVVKCYVHYAWYLPIRW